MAKPNSLDSSITVAKSDPESDSSQPKLLPNFNQILGGYRGYVPEEGVKPDPRNLKVFQEDIFENIFCEGQPLNESWDEVFSELERSMAFWKAYFCGIQ